VFLVLAALSVGALVLSRVVIDNEGQRLLAEQATVVGGNVTTAITATDTSLRSLGTLVSLPGGAASFSAAASPLLTGSVRTIALVRQQPSGILPQVVVGDLLPSAGGLDPQRAALAARALRTPDMVSAMVHDSYRVRLGLALALAPDVGPLVVYEERTADLTNPFGFASVPASDEVHVAFYAAARPSPGSLVETTGAVQGSRAQTVHIPVGADTWTVVASPVRPLTGRFGQLAPWLLLGGGLLSAVLAAAVVEVVLHRRDFAFAVADERTAELRQSLAEVHRAQAELHEAHTALVQSERLVAVGQMASVVSHELRNPLSTVINSLYLARATDDPSARDRALSLAEREALKAARIAEDIVAFARPRNPQPADVVFGSVLDEVFEVLAPPPGVEVDTAGREVVVHADRFHLVEVVSNLVTNAYDVLSGAGTLVVTAAETHGDGTRRSGTVVTVADDGPGVAPELASRIFEPFVTGKHQGTGLGLAIVQRIAESHGGAAWVDTSGSGSRFSVLFPRP
jgi:signal transduction histidine kinase